MKKIALTVLLALVSTAAAQTVDCSTVEIGSFLSFSYKETAVFPNPSKSVNKSLARENIDFNTCGYRVLGDQNKIIIKASSMQSLLKLIGQEESKSVSLSMIGLSGYKYPSIREGFYSYNVWVDIEPATRKVDTFRLEDSLAELALFKDAAIGYKIDDGPMTPFFYEGKVMPFVYPAGTKVIDFYALRGSYSNGYDRFQLDLSNNIITLWKKYDFPKN